MDISTKRYVLTGTPGCGKSSLLLALESQGYSIVREAATDLIALAQAQGHESPWKSPLFIDQIIQLQKQRQRHHQNLQQKAKNLPKKQFYDRSPICTYALAIYLGFKPSSLLLKEIERITVNHIYEKKVFFIENLGFCMPTQARKISFEESLVFEKIHAETYAKFGYECLKIPSVSLSERVHLILELLK